MAKKLKIVVFGGGNCSAQCLRALTQTPEKFDISGVIAMSDSTGSTGALRKAFGVLPPADIMRAVISMSKYDYSILKPIFYKNRISALKNLNKKAPAGRGHSLGNLLLTYLARQEGDFVLAIRALEEAVEAVGRAYPVTLNKTNLYAQLTNGKILKSEGEIDRPHYNRKFKIVKAWLEPQAKIYVGARKIIEQADYIILSPGSFYTSVVASLLPAGVKEAIKKSKAKIIYVAGDAYNTDGETGPEELSGYVEALKAYLPAPLNVVLYNNCKLNKKQKETYKKRHWAQFAKDVSKIYGPKVLGANFEKQKGGLSSEKLAKIFQKIIV